MEEGLQGVPGKCVANSEAIACVYMHLIERLLCAECGLLFHPPIGRRVPGSYSNGRKAASTQNFIG